MTVKASSPHKSYRFDIQGIRAIGALLVLVFHIWLNKVSGGVDVFFVVSGFLMTALLLRTHQNRGRIYLGQFWKRIIRRIVPTAYVVLLATAIASYFFLPLPLLREFTNELLASATFSENIHLMGSSIDYLDASLPPSPVQQFWALSVQMQFLFLLPVLMLLLLKCAPKGRQRQTLTISFAALALASFSYALHQVNANPTTAYYNTFARGWEFLAGGLTFLFTTSRWASLTNNTVRTLLALAGLILLLGGALLLPAGAHFPGLPALVPVLGAISLLVAGASNGAQTAALKAQNNQQPLVSRALSHPALLFLGGISFTLYLWHWPVLVFYQHLYNVTTVSVVGGLFIIGLSFALAWATHKLLEQPLRYVHSRTQWQRTALAMGFLLPVAVSISALRTHVLNVQTDFQAIADQQLSDIFQGGNLQVSPQAAPVSEIELAASRDYLPEPYQLGCHQAKREPEVKICELGKKSADTTVVLVGSSHAAQWTPALHLLGQERDFKLLSMTKSACTFGAFEGASEHCKDWNARVTQAILELGPDMVITNSTRVDEQGEQVLTSSLEQWRKLSNAGIKVIGLRDNPRFRFNPAVCLSHYRNDPLQCAAPRSSFYAGQDPALQYSDVITSVDLTHIYCDSTTCPTNDNGRLMYRDEHHLHVPYVRYMREELAEEISNSLGNHPLAALLNPR